MPDIMACEISWKDSEQTHSSDLDSVLENRPRHRKFRIMYSLIFSPKKGKKFRNWSKCLCKKSPIGFEKEKTNFKNFPIFSKTYHMENSVERLSFPIS